MGGQRASKASLISPSFAAAAAAVVVVVLRRLQDQRRSGECRVRCCCCVGLGCSFRGYAGATSVCLLRWPVFLH